MPKKNNGGLQLDKMDISSKMKASLVDDGYEPDLSNTNDNKTEFLTFNEKEQTLVGVPDFKPLRRRCYYDMDMVKVKKYFKLITRQATKRGFKQGEISDLEHFAMNGRAEFARMILLQGLAYLTYRVYLTVPSSVLEYAKFAKSAFTSPPVVLREFSLSLSLIGNFVKDSSHYEMRYPVATLWYLTELFRRVKEANVDNNAYMDDLFADDIWNTNLTLRCVNDMNYETEVLREIDDLIDHIGSFDININGGELTTCFKKGAIRAVFLQQRNLVADRIVENDEQRVTPLIEDLSDLYECYHDMLNPDNRDRPVNHGNYRFIPEGYVSRNFLRDYAEFSDLNQDFVDKVQKLRFCEPCKDKDGDPAIIYDCTTTLGVDADDQEEHHHTITYNGLMSFANTGYALLYGLCKPVTLSTGYKCVINLDQYVINETLSNRFDRLSVTKS